MITKQKDYSHVERDYTSGVDLGRINQGTCEKERNSMHNAKNLISSFARSMMDEELAFFVQLGHARIKCVSGRAVATAIYNCLLFLT